MVYRCVTEEIWFAAACENPIATAYLTKFTMSRPRPEKGLRHKHRSPSSQEDSDSANETVLLLLGTKCARSIRSISLEAGARGKLDRHDSSESDSDSSSNPQNMRTISALQSEFASNFSL